MNTMAYKLTGLSEIAIGSWEFHKARKNFNEGNISKETSITRKRFNGTKVGIGVLKMIFMGLGANKIASPIIANSNLSAIDIGVLSAFAAGYAVLSFSNVYFSILTDEAINYKYHQSKLENQFKIISNDKSIFELNAGEAYQLYMFGNKISSGNPMDSFLFKIKNKVNEWKLNFQINEDSEYNIIKKTLYKILDKTGIAALMNSIYSKATVKKEAYETLKKFSDLKSTENNEFMKYIKNKHKEISYNEEDIRVKLKDINQEAILKAYQNLLIQNLQIFFTQIVKDYKNNIMHKNLIEKFAELDKQNILHASKTHLIPEYKKISTLARKMINKEDISDKFKDNIETLKYLGSNCIDKNKNIKFLNFENMFKLERKAIINEKNGLIKSNTNIYQDKKACFTEINLNTEDINKFLIVKNPKTLDTKNKIT